MVQHEIESGVPIRAKMARRLAWIGTLVAVTAISWMLQNGGQGVRFTFMVTDPGKAFQGQRILLPVDIAGADRSIALDIGSRKTSINHVESTSIPHLPPKVRIVREVVRMGSTKRDVSVSDVTYSVEQNGKKPIMEGILGLSFFEGDDERERWRLTIDGKRQIVFVDTNPKRGAFQGRPGTVAMPMMQEGGQKLYYVDACINGGPMRRCLLDTGCQYEYLLQDYVKEVPFDYLNNGQRRGNLMIDTHTFLVSVAVQPFSRKWPPIIGLPFFLRFRTTFDFRDRMLYLEPLE